MSSQKFLLENNQPLIKRLKLKSWLARLPFPLSLIHWLFSCFVRIMVIDCGGGTGGGGSNLGAHMGINYSKCSDGVDFWVGVSSGTPNGAHQITKQFGNFRIYPWLVMNGFITGIGLGKKMNINLLEKIFRDGVPEVGIEALNVNNLRKSKQKLIAAFTNMESGEGLLADIAELPDSINGIVGSLAVPWANEVYKLINGHKVQDGMIGEPLPLIEVCKLYKPTDIIIITNHPLDEIEDDANFWETVASYIPWPGMSHDLQKAWKLKYAIYAYILKQVIEGWAWANTTILCPEEKTNRFEKDPVTLLGLYEKMANQTIKILTRDSRRLKRRLQKLELEVEQAKKDLGIN